jgi:capsular exopolysaccharide synthesis family protein
MSRLADARRRAAEGDSPNRNPIEVGPQPDAGEDFLHESSMEPPKGPAQALAHTPSAPGVRVPAGDDSQYRDAGSAIDVDNAATSLGAFRAFEKDVLDKVVLEGGASTGVVEEYRKLASVLHHAQGAHGLKVLMVTSAAVGEGKTLTAINLALTLSQSFHRRVLLADCDLRKPTLHRMFGLENTAGVIDALRSTDDPKVHLVQVMPRLTLMLSGGIAADPITLLSSAVVPNLFRDVSEVFDWVIVDTPPAAILPDSSLLAPAVDAAVVVVGAFDTPYPLVQRAIEAIGRDKVIGAVMNRAERPVSPRYYNGYYTYS